MPAIPLAQLSWGFRIDVNPGPVDNGNGVTGMGYVIDKKATTRYPNVATDFTSTLDFPIWKSSPK